MYRKAHLQPTVQRKSDEISSKSFKSEILSDIPTATLIIVFIKFNRMPFCCLNYIAFMQLQWLNYV